MNSCDGGLANWFSISSMRKASATGVGGRSKVLVTSLAAITFTSGESRPFKIYIHVGGGGGGQFSVSGDKKNKKV